MGGLAFSIHPLFFLFGIYYALTGRIFIFIIYTVSAVVHELGHSFVASRCGYKLNKIKLMPFGAVVSGCFDDVRLIDEIFIALAGPFTNLAVGLFFVALWWIYPSIYAFTDVVAQANFSLFLINVLPAYPLDGGRVLSAFFAQRLPEKKARLILVCSAIILSLFLFGLFAFSLFTVPNLSVLFFALFVLAGGLSRDKENKYVKVFMGVQEQKLLLGMPVKVHAFSKNAQIKSVIACLDLRAVNQVQVFDGIDVVTTLNTKRLNQILQTSSIYDKLEKFI